MTFQALNIRGAQSLLGLMIAFVLVGCVSYVWVKPSGTTTELNRDAAECERAAGQRFPLPKLNENPESWKLRDQFFAECMRGRGYERARRWGLTG